MFEYESVKHNLGLFFHKYKLDIVAWTATTFSLIGIILNAYKDIWCWPTWCTANIFWIYWAWQKNEKSQIILWFIFTVFNIFGWFQWLQ